MKKTIFIAAIAVALGVALGCQKKEKEVAAVGPAKVTDAEVKRTMSRKAAQADVQKPEEKGRKRAVESDRKEALDSVISRKLLYLEGVRMGIKPSDQQIEAEIVKVKAGFPNEEAFKNALKAEDLTGNSFRKEIEEGLIADGAGERLTANLTVSEKDAKAYFRKNRKDFDVPERYKIYLVLAAQEQNALHLANMLKKEPEKFDTMALEQVEPELQQINKNAALTQKFDFPDEMHPYLKTMKIGSIEGPIKTKRGYFLFKLLERQPSGQRSWEEAKRDVQHMALQEKKQAAIDKWLVEQRKKTKVSVLE